MIKYYEIVYPLIKKTNLMMSKKIILSLCCMYCFVCLAQQKSVETDKNLFDITFDVEAVAVDKFSLSFALELAEGQYTISPFSEDGFYLPITISWLSPDVYFVPGRLEETPRSVYEFDMIIEKQVRFVKENTTYTQYFDWTPRGDTNMKCMVELLVEPSCIPYDVHFDLVSKNGEVSVNNITIIVSPEYKL
jgi:hypothetical protein